jgi:hypothetical protein
MRVMVTVTGVACDKEARSRVMPKAMRVVGRAMAMATATRVVGEVEGEVGKGDGDGNEETTTRQ